VRPDSQISSCSNVVRFVHSGDSNLPVVRVRMTTSVTREFGIVACDVFVALILFVLATAFAGAVRELVGFRWVYSVSFAIGMLPLGFYARYRGVVQFDRWDVVAWSPFPILVGIVGIWSHDSLAFLLVAIVSYLICSGIRRFLPASQRQTTSHAR
jgi:hypothetical protein